MHPREESVVFQGTRGRALLFLRDDSLIPDFSESGGQTFFIPRLDSFEKLTNYKNSYGES